MNMKIINFFSRTLVNMKWIYIVMLALLFIDRIQAQTPTDGFTMSKGEICTVMDRGGSTWTNYWEGKRYRDNPNIGRFSSLMWMPMLGYGLTSKLNLFAGLPHITTNSTGGFMTGMRGWQDLQLEVKYRLVKKQNERGIFYTFFTAGVSAPATDYVPDHLPFSIGLGTKNLTGRTIIHYEHKKGFYYTIQTGYTLKSNITVARQTYYNSRQVMSNEMPVPNIWDGTTRFGFKKKSFRADVHYNWMISTSGSDMRLYDMPYPFHRMNATSIGITGLYWIPLLDGLAIHGNVDQTISGRNMGKSFMWSTGFQYVFNPFKNKK